MIAIKKRQLLPLLPSQALLVDNSHSSRVFVVLLQINRSMADTLINPLGLWNTFCVQRDPRRYFRLLYIVTILTIENPNS